MRSSPSALAAFKLSSTSSASSIRLALSTWRPHTPARQSACSPSLPPTYVLTDLQRRALAENVRLIITKTIPAVKAGTKSGVEPLVNQLANPRFQFLKQIPEARAALIEALEGAGVSLPLGL